MDAITETLIGAGYFRARISSLSEFDKIIGGMAWAMQVFSRDVDLNIFFADSLDLGQKIALTERLVMLLLVLQCPHRLEPHQIVGLDYASLLVTIRWLVKRSAQVRQEHEAFNKLLALRHYHRVTAGNNRPDSQGRQLAPQRQRENWCQVVRADHMRELAEAPAARALELASEPGGGSELVAAAKLAVRLADKFALNREVSLVQVPSVLLAGARRAPQQPLDAAIAGRVAELEPAPAQGRPGGANDSVDIDAFHVGPELYEGNNNEQGTLDDIDEHVQWLGAACENPQFKQMASRCVAIETASVETLATLGSAELELPAGEPALIVPAPASSPTPTPTPTATLTPTEALATSTQANTLTAAPPDLEHLKAHSEADIELMATNQKVLNLLKKLDSVPDELEVAQYQRRYIELHQQLISKNKDLKKLCALFNSLDSERHYLSKEITLLESIMLNLDLVHRSAQNKHEFIKQLQHIIASIKSVRDEVLAKLKLARRRCEQLEAEQAALNAE